MQPAGGLEAGQPRRVRWRAWSRVALSCATVEEAARAGARPSTRETAARSGRPRGVGTRMRMAALRGATNRGSTCDPHADHGSNRSTPRHRARNASIGRDPRAATYARRMASLTRDEAVARADLLDGRVVPRSTWTCRRAPATAGRVRLHHHGPVRLPPARGRRPSWSSSRPAARGARSTAWRLDPAGLDGQPAAAARPGRPRTSWWCGARMALLQHRRGAAPVRRPGGRATSTSTRRRSSTRRSGSSPASTSPTSRRRSRSRVTAPAGLDVAGNARRAPRSAPGRWEFATDARRSRRTCSASSPGRTTCAATSTTASRSPLYCRRALAPHLDKDVDEIFADTRAFFDRYHELFGVRYPFGKYDQAFVPEFNAGAMENAGLVTFRDEFLFRSAVTDDERRAAGPVSSPTRWPTCGSATWSPCAGGTTCG